MPQAVKEYAESRDFDRVDQVKRDILNLYRADIAKHAQGYEMKVASIFDEIPAQLQKHEKKFKLSSLRKFVRKYGEQTLHTRFIQGISKRKKGSSIFRFI